MLAPSSLTIGKIPNRVTTPRTELPGARLEVETLTGPGGTPLGMSLTVEQLAEYFSSSPGTGPNHSNSLHKAYRYLTRAEIAANGGYGEAFEDLDYATCCIQTRVWVEKYQPDPTVPMVINQVLVAVWDSTAYQQPEKWVHVDGSFREGDKTPAKFVPIESVEAKYGYVRRDTDPASITDWQLEELSIWNLNGTDQFATAKQAGGPFPAYTGVADAYWEPAAPPVKAALYDDTELRNLLRLTSADNPAAPESRLRGLVDWHYETVVGQSFYQLKAGRSVMFNSGRELVPPTDVQEGDVFGILISPTATAQRIELSARNFGGIDAYPQRRYIRATTMVLRWTLLEEIVDPDTGDVQQYFGYTTIQQTQPNTVVYRGAWSSAGYYIAGDLVNYQGGLCLRAVEGGDGSDFNSANWIGGGASSPGTPGGTSYTDALARAAQLNRVAPAGTTTVTLTAEAPTDYGTATSGSFTVDATNCVLGKEAYFNIGAGGSAPIFANASSGQGFDLELGKFVANKFNRYAVRVFLTASKYLTWLANELLLRPPPPSAGGPCPSRPRLRCLF
jgi:hypothetical protein